MSCFFFSTELEKCLESSNRGDYYDAAWCKWNVQYETHRQFIFQFPLTLLRAEEITNRLVDRKWIKHLMVQVLKFENRLLLLVLRCFKWNILGGFGQHAWWPTAKIFHSFLLFSILFFKFLFLLQYFVIATRWEHNSFVFPASVFEFGFWCITFHQNIVVIMVSSSLIYEVNSY